jgi:hypothetical protein
MFVTSYVRGSFEPSASDSTAAASSCSIGALESTAVLRFVVACAYSKRLSAG